MAEMSEKFSRAVITERRDLADDLWVIRVQPENKLAFQPGQYATFGLVEDTTVVERPYSIVSSPYEKDLEFFIELVPQGALTPRLHKLQVGAELVIRKVAKGRFTLDRKSGRKKHLFVATVTGIAPYCSMIRTLHREGKEGRFPEGFQVFLLQGASRSWEFGYREEMERLAAEVPWLAYIPTISRPWEDKQWQGEVGRVEDVLRKYADQFAFTPENSTAYLCGHPQMIETARAILLRRGFPKESLLEEQYWVQK